MFKATKLIKLSGNAIETKGLDGKDAETEEFKTEKAARKAFEKMFRDLDEDGKVRIEGTSDDEITLFEWSE